MSELENEATRLWIEALSDSYKAAFNERSRELRGDRPRRFDLWGVHLFSEAWGSLVACEELFPFLREVRLPRGGLRTEHPDEGLPVTAAVMRSLARSDAERAYALDIIKRAQEPML